MTQSLPSTEQAPASLAALSSALERRYPPRHELHLELGEVGIVLRSNSAPLVGLLREYFGTLVREAPVRVAAPSRTGLSIRAFEAPPPDFGCSWRYWPWDPGKAGPKEQFFDLPDGRVVSKVRTQMQFLLGRSDLVAVGPCLDNANQIINFINSQYISQRLHDGWSLCHAAGVAHAGRGIGIAARAGAGKSTLALHLLSSGLSFVSNDRLLIQRTEGGAEMAGIPKMPRVNPGTLLNNPDLAGILPAERQRALAAQSREELWDLEEKYDVMVDAVYGPERIVYRTSLTGLLILNWSWKEGGLPTEFKEVQLEERSDLLDLVMKSPGAFHRDELGQSASETARPDPASYLQVARGLRVWEAKGAPNFELAVRFCQRALEA
jgi:HprK-related kinase B